MSKYDVDLNLDDRNSLSVSVARIKPDSMVLEFGPANGRMTKYMKEQLNCKVYAVEIDEKAAKDAEPYTEKIIVESIENYSWQKEFQGLQFDYIIFADVLEHLYYPEKVLQSVKDFLKMDGSILVSIPNIAHNSIIINLLKNEFNYTQTGLLDDTHIRFFTKKTFDKLIEKAGLFRVFETAIFIGPENTEFMNSYNDLPFEISDFLHNKYYGEAYQFIYELKQYPCQVISDFSDDYKVNSRFFSQLFLDHGNGVSEENSIKLPVAQNTDVQEFLFDLSDKSALTALRLDPLNDSCVVEIEKCMLITDQDEIDLCEYISSNALIHHGKSYFFDHNDSQIYFNDFSLEKTKIKKLITRMRFSYVGKDATQMCISQTIINKDHIIASKDVELDQTKTELDQTKTELDQTKTELDQTKTELDQTKATIGWKLTKPLRAIKKILKGN